MDVPNDLEARISRLRDLLEPLRRSAFEEARETNQAWRQDSYGIVAAALGCSPSELMQLAGIFGVASDRGDEGPPEGWNLAELPFVSVLLPLGVMDRSLRPEWLEITRYRRPRTPRHTWRLERKFTVHDGQWGPHLQTHWGWYQAELTSQTVAIACQVGAMAHYFVNYRHMTWTDAGERAGVAPSDSQRAVERIELLTQMLTEDRPQYRLQVIKEGSSADEGESNDSWGYRILDAAGRVVAAASMVYCGPEQKDRERSFATRAAAVRAGQGRLDYLQGGSNSRGSGWQEIEPR